MTVTALNCPVCSGPMKMGVDRCDYCGSTVIIKTDMVRIDPQSLNQGVIHQHISDFRNRVFANPNDATAHYGLGIAYFNLGLLEEASNSLSEAARLMPENPNIQMQHAQILWGLFQSGNPNYLQALSNRLDRVLTLRPEDGNAILLKAIALHLLGNNIGAIGALFNIPDGYAEQAIEVVRPTFERLTFEQSSALQKELGSKTGQGPIDQRPDPNNDAAAQPSRRKLRIAAAIATGGASLIAEAAIKSNKKTFDTMRDLATSSRFKWQNGQEGTLLGPRDALINRDYSLLLAYLELMAVDSRYRIVFQSADGELKKICPGYTSVVIKRWGNRVSANGQVNKELTAIVKSEVGAVPVSVPLPYIVPKQYSQDYAEALVRRMAATGADVEWRCS